MTITQSILLTVHPSAFLIHDLLDRRGLASWFLNRWAVFFLFDGRIEHNLLSNASRCRHLPHEPDQLGVRSDRALDHRCPEFAVVEDEVRLKFSGIGFGLDDVGRDHPQFQ